jgi:hypothetical protein
MLYWDDDVANVAQLISAASEKLKPLASGIGFLGSPGWCTCRERDCRSY